MRLNKFLARYAGVSRREADRLIEAGRVSVDGKPAVLGIVLEDDRASVFIDDRAVVPDDTRRYFAVYKPVGYISSTVKQTPEDRLVTDLVKEKDSRRLFPMGRLDKDSEGLMILTDDGELMDRVLRSRYGHEKEYLVKLSSPITDDIIKKICDGGIDIGDRRPTKACKVKRVTSDEVFIILSEGMNREIRRIFDLFDISVVSLCRVRFMDIKLGGLKPGESRPLSEDEIRGMKDRVKSSMKDLTHKDCRR